MIIPLSGPTIAVRGARQNNLRGIDVDFPRGRLTVITGVSGSGKSSLALDTLYAEGQRRYIASLTSYARQFLDQLPRPDVDSIDGLPPAIAIEQRNPVVNRRSTVGTATEVYDYLRLLFARTGVVACPECDRAVRPISPVSAADGLLTAGEGDHYVTFELPISNALTHEVLVDNLRALGFVRLLASGREVHLDDVDEGVRDLTTETPIYVVVDRIRIGSTPRARVVEAIERAYTEGEGEAVIFARDDTDPQAGRRVSRHYRCDGCGRPFRSPRPAMFSFNSPYGACPECNGFGNLLEFDEELIVPDTSRSLADGALDPWSRPRYAKQERRLKERVDEAGIPWGTPWKTLPDEARRVLLSGGRYEGVSFGGAIPFLERLVRKKYKPHVRFFLRKYQSYRRCPGCGGSRLRPEAGWVRVEGETLPEMVRQPLPRLARWLDTVESGDGPAEVLDPILRELRQRVSLLLEVGLDYLTLDRLTRTLSGGEAQRISVANALGTPLTDGLYVLDEPTVGLHARDKERILELLSRLTEMGNTVVVVEHDLDVIRAADHVVELGPDSGSGGGDVVFAGPPDRLEEFDTVTAAWIRGEADLPPRKVHPVDGPTVTVRGARSHNLKSIEARFPLGALTAVTGVSGSGKSTLVHDVLYRDLARRFGSSIDPEGATEGRICEAVEGWEWLRGVVLIDQTPIGKSPRSNPVTYVQAFEGLRKLFAQSAGARRLGFKPGHFSFNTKAGRCPECRGDGHRRIEMVFLPDVFVTCEECRGRRYRPEVLEVRWRGVTIAELLEHTVDDAIGMLEGEPAAARGLWVLQAVGLGYLRLGQPATTLSGGEAQRLKIARELTRSPKASRGPRASGIGTLYIMDEPTTGLHDDDIRVLARVVDRLVDRGDTVVMVEHHLGLVARADWVVDLGPEGGDAGGLVVASGRPEDIAACDGSHTGEMLRRRARSAERLLAS